MTDLLVALGESPPLAIKSLLAEALALGRAVGVSVAFLAVVTGYPTGNKHLEGEFILAYHLRSPLWRLHSGSTE